MEATTRENVKVKDTWMRGIFILLFTFAYSIAEIVLAAVVFLQFLFLLFTAEKNINLLNLGDDVSRYIYQVMRYLTFNSDEKPFPFTDWPGSERKKLE